MGWLGRGAAVSLWGSFIGVLAAMIAGKAGGGATAVWIALGIWYFPALAWLLAIWASAAREHFGATAAAIAGLCAMAVFSIPPDDADLLPLLLLGLVIVSAGLALGGRAARALLDWGKER